MPPDLSEKLTVFVITVGGPTAKACLAAVKGQTCKFRLDVIENVAPMSAAFQEMLDRCETPYFIQVDEDMILKPHAVQQIYNSISTIGGNVAFVCFGLWDTHIGMPIIGVKGYRHDICKLFPYVDEQSCEVGQLERMREEGYTYRAFLPATRDDKDTLGDHTSCLTPWQAYERYKDLMEKQRKHGQCGWVERLPAQFAKRLGVNPESPDLWALFGLLAGSGSDIDRAPGEKDFRTYGKDPAYATMLRLLSKSK
jgi:hypothetical protein